MKENLVLNAHSKQHHLNPTFKRGRGFQRRRAGSKRIIRRERQQPQTHLLHGKTHPMAAVLVENPDSQQLKLRSGFKGKRTYRKNRHGRETSTRKPCIEIVEDKIPQKSLVVIEALLKESPLNFSDFTFEHLGDVVKNGFPKHMKGSLTKLPILGFWDSRFSTRKNLNWHGSYKGPGDHKKWNEGKPVRHNR